MYYQGVKKTIVTRPVPKKRAKLGEMHPVLERIFVARGLTSEAELDRTLAKLPSPWLLSGMEEMVGHLIAAINEQQRICIVADFDADGATSCAVAIKGLQLLGAGQVTFVVPNRFEYGYGLTPEIVGLVQLQNPDVIITVDNGISSIDGVRVAKELGIKVLITDHHLPAHELPAADAIVNPNLVDDKFPSGALAGVGVMFYVLMALRSRLREQNWFERRQVQEPNLAQLLDYVALGTVADVVAMDRINRVLVHQGLLRIRTRRSHP
ncbi:MAG: DHH family phosphoesterase, partial [Methylobacter sp.]|nr:DHH family phosphoesterase [Methylobacter sp.]